MMDTAAALALLLSNLIRLSEFATAIGKAHAEGRSLTAEEVNAFRAADDAARERLQREIDARS
jgi:ABC-type uncharacterized transport system fused permease/ATPase subunit